MVAGSAEVTVVRRAFLLAVRLADRAIHIEDDSVHGLALPNSIDPQAGEIPQATVGFIIGEDLRLLSGHLTR